MDSKVVATNPWRLSPQEAAVLALWAELGNLKLVAKALGTSYWTIVRQKHSARNKMGVRFSIQCLVIWDRWYAATTGGGRE